jgi:xanthine dehydrogenase YagR molybdenum-binding subunit
MGRRQFEYRRPSRVPSPARKATRRGARRRALAFARSRHQIGVDVDTAEIRLRRMLGIFAPGRILNAKTARSQLIGAMTFGMGMALLEEAVVDTRSGAFVNRDLAEYLVPVHADIPDIDVVVLDGFDDKANVVGVKGLGELGICGAGAAVANAVFNATGVRVRDFPITLDKVLPGLPLMDA